MEDDKHEADGKIMQKYNILFAKLYVIIRKCVVKRFTVGSDIGFCCDGSEPSQVFIIAAHY
jgi:hypothetical protein